jgi:hypothetical protein
MKLDRFTWLVIILVAALLVAAVVTVNVTGGAGWGSDQYVEEDTPEAVVYNAFLALEDGDLIRAREYYTKRVHDEIDEQQGGYDPLRGRTEDNASRRLRVTEVEVDSNNPDRAVVHYIADHYDSNGGLFSGGNTWTSRGSVEVVREDGSWKIDTQEFFY